MVFLPQLSDERKKNVKLAKSLREAKAAGLHNYNACPDLFAVSVYDTKPVHILLLAVDCVEWIVKKQKVWDTTTQQKEIMKYLCLNVIEDYNHHISDELDRHCRPALWQLSAGPMDATEGAVVGVFHLGNWGGRGECV